PGAPGLSGWQFPLADPGDPGRPPKPPGVLRRPLVRAARTAARRRQAGRLAVLDTHFPWLISGFRYHEAEEILRRRPDTLFFSLFGLTDPFPAPVHPLASFPERAAAAGVTDVYLVFLNFAAGILGVEGRPGVP